MVENKLQQITHNQEMEEICSEVFSSLDGGLE